MTDYYLNNLKIPFPIAIWKAKKAENEDGGYTPESAGPNFQNYPMVSKPVIWILDGNGTVRRTFIGYSREKEAQIARTLQFLLKEASAQTGVTSADPPSTLGTTTPATH